MLKRDLVNKVAGQLGGYYKKDVALAVDLILEEISKALVEGRRVEIRGFGSFKIRSRKQREGRNPKTGSPVSVPAKKVPFFKAGKELKELVDN